jgi:hypothetical protein
MYFLYLLISSRDFVVKYKRLYNYNNNNNNNV